MSPADPTRPLAVGRTAEIYARGEGRIVKLYFDWFDLDSIRFEQRMARAVHASGLPVTAPGEIVRVKGRRGLVYERAQGRNMWTCLQERPARCFALAQRMAGLHAEMHANRARPDLPAQHQRLERKINHAPVLADPLRQALLAALDRLPDGDRICHGDFHPGNILLAPGRDVVIDWVDASLGNPLADVARTSVLLLGAAASHQVRHPFHRLVLRLFHAVYLGHYFRLRTGGQAEYRRWLPVVAGARLSEGIAGLEPWLLALAGRVPAK